MKLILPLPGCCGRLDVHKPTRKWLLQALICNGLQPRLLGVRARKADSKSWPFSTASTRCTVLPTCSTTAGCLSVTPGPFTRLETTQSIFLQQAERRHFLRGAASLRCGCVKGQAWLP